MERWYTIISFDQKLLDKIYTINICKTDEYYKSERFIFKKQIIFENEDRFHVFLEIIKNKR